MAKILDEEQKKKLELAAARKSMDNISANSTLPNLEGYNKEDLIKPSIEEKAAILKNNKEHIAQGITENPDIKDSEKKKAINYITNDKAIDKTTTKMIKKEAVGDDTPAKSSADQFKEALMFFAPQLIAGAVGGVLEGDAGIVAGYQAGGQARDAFINYKTNEREMQLKEEKLNLAEKKALAGPAPKPYQQLRDSFITDANGNMTPALLDPISGNVINPVTKQIIKSADQLTTSEARRLKQASSLSDRQVDAVKGFENSLSALDAIDGYKAKVNTGPLIGRTQSLGSSMDMASPEFVALRTETENAKADFLKSMSGAQVSDNEARRLANIIPNVKDDDGTFKAKSLTFRKILQRHRSSIAEAIKTGQPLKADVVNEMKREALKSGLYQEEESGASVNIDMQMSIIDKIMAKRKK